MGTVYPDGQPIAIATSLRFEQLESLADDVPLFEPRVHEVTATMTLKRADGRALRWLLIKTTRRRERAMRYAAQRNGHRIALWLSENAPRGVKVQHRKRARRLARLYAHGLLRAYAAAEKKAWEATR